MQVLITDDVHPLLLTELRQLGFAVRYEPAIDYQATLTMITDYEGLVINSKICVGEELLTKATQLKWAVRLGSGMEVFDAEACKAHGVQVYNTPEGNSNAVAEHTLGLLLNLMNNISKANHEVKQNQWLREANRGEELNGKTVGIIAYGNTGEAFGKVLKGFDVQLLAYDKYKKGFGNEQVKEATLQEIFEQADVLSLHLPLTAETAYMIDEQFLNSFRKPIYLINTSRGKVLETAALLNALESGKVKAAALDVLENEKISELTTDEREWFDTLIQNKRVIMTPHIAGWTVESKRKIAEVVVERVRAYLLLNK